MISVSHFASKFNNLYRYVEENKIPDPLSAGCRKSDCDTLFILCNFVENKADKQLSLVNDDHALMRYEFVEVGRCALNPVVDPQLETASTLCPGFKVCFQIQPVLLHRGAEPPRIRQVRQGVDARG